MATIAPYRAATCMHNFCYLLVTVHAYYLHMYVHAYIHKFYVLAYLYIHIYTYSINEQKLHANEDVFPRDNAYHVRKVAVEDNFQAKYSQKRNWSRYPIQEYHRGNFFPILALLFACSEEIIMTQEEATITANIKPEAMNKIRIPHLYLLLLAVQRSKARLISISYE